MSTFLISIPIFLLLVVGLIASLYTIINPRRYKASKKIFEVSGKKSSSILPYEILSIRGTSNGGFHKYYYFRINLDNEIIRKIECHENILIIGNPLSGKSRMIYETLLNLKNPLRVYIPRLDDIRDPEDIQMPFRFKSRETVVVLNDLDKYVEKDNFLYLLQIFIKCNTLIIASCRSGKEYDKLRKYIEYNRFDILSIFKSTIEIQKIWRQEAEKIAKETGRDLLTFDGNIGSIFISLETMKMRFEECSDINKGILRSLKRLYIAGIYKEREIYSIEKIKHVYEEVEGIKIQSHELNELIQSLKKMNFIEIREDDILIETAYLQSVIEYDFDDQSNLEKMTDIFSNDPAALVMIGNKAYSI